MNSADCVILVPVASSIEFECEAGLRELERRGYTVRRIRGYSAIDAARCQIATDALRDGYEELMWIDSDIGFSADDVEKLRSHRQPFTCGIYPKKGPRQFANTFHRGMHFVQFGLNGGLHDIPACGFGFTHTRREVYESVKRQFNLPECNRSFRTLLIPYFSPMVSEDTNGEPWYLNEDFSFCERARQSGFRIIADTTIRLWHVGRYLYGWEDVGRDQGRVADYTFHITDADSRVAAVEKHPAKNSPARGFTEDWFSKNIVEWSRFLSGFAERPCNTLEIGVFEGRSSVWLLENILTHPESRLDCVDTFEGGVEHAAMNLAELEQRFRDNTRRFEQKITVRKGRSSELIRNLPTNHFDFVSIDGSHEAADVMSDAVLVWPLLRSGGLICFDDYEWWIDSAPQRSPKLAIDSFLAVMKGRFELLHKGWQVWIRKL